MSAAADAMPRPGDARPENMRRYVCRARTAARLLAALASGLLLTSAFPPLEWDLAVWVALLPLLLAPVPPRLAGRVALGWVFGFAHYVTSLAWLNEVGFGAGVLLAIVCALFPMVWYVLSASLRRELQRPEASSAGRSDGSIPSAPIVALDGVAGQCLLVLLLPALWVALEWIRGWILTGFPWNQLGISQWQRPSVLRVVPITGVYGITYMIVGVNIALAFTVRRWWRHVRQGQRLGRPVSLALAVVLLAPIVWLSRSPVRVGAPDSVLRVLAVQGNIPQCREWSQEQLDLALEVYTGLSRQAAPTSAPDLIVWPETAVPAPIHLQQYATALGELLAEVQTPMLLGTVHYQWPAAAQDGGHTGTDAEPLGFNSALLLGADGMVLERYDKTHLVPFGEYVPFDTLWPWLVDMIGMGRGLTPGRQYTVFALPRGAKAGVNICYEDVYTGISRQFVLRGANMLMTLTNDAWYAESAGSRQHMIHAVLRAVEHRRPLLRSGNNSDTCLIWPDGRVSGLLYDPVTDNRFVRGTNVYEIPVWNALGYTFYTLHGDVFAVLCTMVSGLVLAGLLVRWYGRKQRLLARISEPSVQRV